MSTTMADRRIGGVGPQDQAAGLRRLFAPSTARVLPLLSSGPGGGCNRWLARLGEAFARAGQTTVLVDASRAQIAATLGLRARFDLLHALNGQCSADEVMLDAAQGLIVIPAARACESALAAGEGLVDLLSRLPIGDAAIILLLIAPCTARRASLRGDVLVPVLPTGDSVGRAVTGIVEASDGATPVFRMLFLGMEPAAAGTLEQRMGQLIGARSRAALGRGITATVARDLAKVVALASEFSLTEVAPTDKRRVAAEEMR